MVGQLFLVQSCVGSIPSTPETGEEKKRDVGNQSDNQEKGV
jgi:hypothetical protein